MNDLPSTQIVFLDRATLPPTVALRAPSFAHSMQVYDWSDERETAARIATADIVITNKARITAQDLAAASRLKLIAVAATGFDNVDVNACAKSGIDVCNIRGYAVHTVPEYTFALILALRRNLLGYRNSVLGGRWEESGQFCYFDFPISSLAGATLSVIGDGPLGRAVADIGRAFRMQVLFAAYEGSQGMGSLYTPFEEVLRRSDVITLHVPLLASTRNLIGTAEFEAMARRLLLINTARGGLVEEAALVDAIEQGLISGAGFDVASIEPPSGTHALMRIARRDNVVVTPHVAWASHEAVQTLADQLIENIELFVHGSPRNLVSRAVA